MIREHRIAVVLLLLAARSTRRLDRSDDSRVGTILTRYDGLDTGTRVLFWMLLLAGTIHPGLR
ncbi:MAG: hypothetical protein GY720_17850 [bacterium]|nr:hypothetical protein [bacterium]